MNDIVLLLFALLIPAVMVLFGILMKKSPPKEINAVMGYRTQRSMKTKQTWAFAHKYAGKLWICLGVPMLVASALLMLLLPYDSANVSLVLVFVQFAVLVGSIAPVEHALKKNFDKYGWPKNETTMDDEKRV